jgi:type 2 lantibiotic biosynthesis protein LanM
VVLDRGTHGWMQLVEPAPCRSRDELDRFYRRHGAWLALGYVLSATDLHFENVLAAGEHPVPIDLETLFHPRVFEHPNATADDVAQGRIDESVSGVGLLPYPVWSAEAGGPVDLSGMGAAFEDAGPIRGQRMVDVGTDRMRVEVASIEPARHHNRPRLRDVAADPRSWCESIEAGFEAAYRLLQRERRYLANANGPLAACARERVRVVVRPTRSYVALLEDATHPNSLADALEREQLLDQLWTALHRQEWRAPLVGLERAQLLEGDVPYFSAEADGRDLLSSAGDAPHCVLATGVGTARARLAAMGDEDLAWQLWVTRAALATKRAGAPLPGRGAAPDAGPLELAGAAGAWLDAAAARLEDAASWVGLVPVAKPGSDADAWRAEVAGCDLYDGVPGIALALGALGDVTGDAGLIRLARAALATLHARPLAHDVSSIGGFAGWGGLVHCWTRLGLLWDDAALLDRALGGAAQVRARVGTDRQLDVIAGAAGSIPALLGLATARPDGAALDAAIACGEHLLAYAPEWNELPMRLGMSHGPAGAAWALALLHEATGEQRFADAARQAVAAERGRLESTGTWTDHDDPAGVTSMAAWCHGAPGIALSRLVCWRVLGDADLRRDAEAALERTLAEGPMPGAALCHGDLGNLEALTLGAQVLADDPRWSLARDERASRVLERLRCDGLRTSLPRNLEAPGLMNGISGVAYGLLRINHPDRVPSVLLLAT